MQINPLVSLAQRVMTSLATVPRYSSTSLLFFGASRASVEMEMKNRGVLKSTIVSTSWLLPPKHRQSVLNHKVSINVFLKYHTVKPDSVLFIKSFRLLLYSPLPRVVRSAGWRKSRSAMLSALFLWVRRDDGAELELFLIPGEKLSLLNTHAHSHSHAVRSPLTLATGLPASVCFIHRDIWKRRSWSKTIVDESQAPSCAPSLDVVTLNLCVYPSISVDLTLYPSLPLLSDSIDAALCTSVCYSICKSFLLSPCLLLCLYSIYPALFLCYPVTVFISLPSIFPSVDLFLCLYLFIHLPIHSFIDISLCQCLFLSLSPCIFLFSLLH